MKGKQDWWTSTTTTATTFPQLIHMKLTRRGFIYDDGSHSPGLSLHWVGPAAFQFQVSLTIELRVAVHHWRDADQHLPSVSLHHQLQLPARLLDQLPRVAERQVFCHRAVNLTEIEEMLITVLTAKKQCGRMSPVLFIQTVRRERVIVPKYCETGLTLQ